MIRAIIASIALGRICNFLTWKEIDDLPIIVFCDNKSAVMLSESNISSKKLKHVATKVAFLRELVKEKTISIHHIMAAGQVADIFTKPLGAGQFHQLRLLLLG